MASALGTVESGMTLRDYFAAHCPMPISESLSWDDEAKYRFAYADAMIARRGMKS